MEDVWGKSNITNITHYLLLISRDCRSKLATQSPAGTFTLAPHGPWWGKRPTPATPARHVPHVTHVTHVVSDCFLLLPWSSLCTAWPWLNLDSTWTERRIVHVHTTQPPEVRPQILRFCVQAEVLSEWWHACPGPYRPVKCPSNPRFPVECHRDCEMSFPHPQHLCCASRSWTPQPERGAISPECHLMTGCANLLWLGAD